MAEKKKLGPPYKADEEKIQSKTIRIYTAIEPEVIALKKKYKKRFMKSIDCNN